MVIPTRANVPIQMSQTIQDIRSFHYLQAEDFEPYFSGRRKLLPRHSDLSFYNWDTNHSTSNSTVNYQVNRGSGRRGGGRRGRGREEEGCGGEGETGKEEEEGERDNGGEGHR